MDDCEVKQTFWEHLDVLRSAIIKIVVAALLFGGIAFCFKETLFSIVLAPKYDDFLTYKLINRVGGLWGVASENFSVQLINTSLAQQFIIHMRTALYAGLLCVSPYILYQLFRFISPALYTEEKKYVYRVMGFSYFMFLIGLLLSYFVIFPLTFRFLGTYQVCKDVVNMIAIDSYIATFMGMCLIMGLVFELPIICWLFAKLGFIDSTFLKKYRKHAIIIILVVAAIITPTSDVFTLLLVSIPMWILYEISIAIISKGHKLITN